MTKRKSRNRKSRNKKIYDGRYDKKLKNLHILNQKMMQYMLEVMK